LQKLRISLKILSLLFIFVFASCGKKNPPPPSGGGGQNGSSYTYENNGLHYPESDSPVIFYVNSQKYYTYKESFDLAEESYRSKTGKQLVHFVPRDENPKFTNFDDSSSLWTENGERWVMFKENQSEFQDIDGAAGVALYSWNYQNQLVYGEIVIDETEVSQGYYFQQVILHEVGHVLGFNHTFENDYSLMNYNYTYETDGLTYLDIQRTHEKYPFSMVGTYIKDLEKIAALTERKHLQNFQDYVTGEYGLSEKRAKEVSKMIFGYNKIKAKRSLTEKDKNLLTQKLLGFSYETGKKALGQMIAGESSGEIEDLFQKAADKNNIDPEHVKILIGDIFLK